jgi:hypothetical protein
VWQVSRFLILNFWVEILGAKGMIMVVDILLGFTIILMP